jgi:hypothetical protein
VPSKALRWAAVLVLAASQTAIGGRAFARSGMSHGGHFVASSHFGHHRFDHRLRKRLVLIAPYGWNWPNDYGEVPSAGYGNTTIVAYPPPLSTARATDCRWNEDTFTVPSSAGGTSPIKVVSCR